MRLSLIVAAFALAIVAPTFAASPFSDVPQGHWAYKAIEKAVEAGILQGYDGKFHGNKTLNRYQMAVVVARMLDRIETMGPSGKVGKKDIENLEALTIEFADELALLNVKVSTLEDSFAELKKDVEGLKKDYALGGARAGISGLAQVRMAFTDDDHNAAHNALAGTATANSAATVTPFISANLYNTGATTIANTGAFNAATPYAVLNGTIAQPAGTTIANPGVAATNPVARYIAGTSASGGQSSRVFADLTQASFGFDRHFDEDFYLHAQFDIAAAQEDSFLSGKAIQVNELYVDAEKWLFDGDIRGRVGTWALPFQRERNPEMVEYPNQLRFGYRTLDLTISPTFWDQNWEAIRTTGAGIWNGKDSGFQWQLAAFSSTSPGFNRDGSLLAWREAAASGVGMGRRNAGPGYLAGLGAAYPGFAGGAAYGTNQFGTGGLYGDTLQSIDSNASFGIQSNMGFYAWVGDKYDGGFRWDAGYFDNGGNLNPAAGDIGSASEWRGFQVNAGWWGWEDWGFMGSYYHADSDSQTFGPGTAGTFNNPAGGAANFVGLGLYPFLAGTNAYPDVESRSWSALMNYKFNDDNNVTVRYEDIEDTMGAASLEGKVWTFDWNHRISPNSLLQIEWSTPSTESVAVLPGTVVGTGTGAFSGGTGAAIRNSADVADDLIQINYKVKF